MSAQIDLGAVSATVQPSLVQICRMGLITIHVSNLERSVKFYGDVLGFAKEQEQMMQPGVTLRAVDVQVYLNPGCDSMERRSGACPEISLSFVVDGVRASYERLRDAGVMILDDYFQPSLAFATVQFADPDGNMLELIGKP